MGKVIFSCFAGRQRYMEILSGYIRILKQRNLVDEIHIWDYTRNREDSLWLEREWSENIFKVNDKSTFIEYYDYYNKERYPEDDTVLVKCDDDIVYIDVDSFENFIKKRKQQVNVYIMSPMIVNHPTTSHILQRNNCEIIHDDFFSPKFCTFIHEKFLNNELSRIHGLVAHVTDDDSRFNINFIAILSKDFFVFKHPSIKIDDEGTLSKLSQLNNWYIVIDGEFFVSHMAFTKQREDGFDENELLEKYRSLFENSLGILCTQPK